MGLLSGSGSCPAAPASASVKGEPVMGSLTTQHLFTICSWACGGVSAMIWLVLVVSHLRRYQCPNEQRQIFRIVSTPLIFTIFAIISVHAYNTANYLEPLSNLYESFALASLFLLYVQYVHPDEATRIAFFGTIEHKDKKGNSTPGGSIRWFRATWRTVFLYLVIYTGLVAAQEITMATSIYCATSSSIKFAHIWIQTLQLISTIVPVVFVIKFQRRLRDHMVGKGSMSKLVVFKLFLGVTTLQKFIISIIQTKVSGNSKVTFNDITIGLPALLTCVEGVIFMIANYFVFTAKQYRSRKEETGPCLSFGKALLDAMNPMDLVRGIVAAFGMYRARK